MTRWLVILIVSISCNHVGLLLQILLRHYVVLLGRYAAIFKEVSENTLKIYHYYWIIKLIWPSSEIMPISSFEIDLSLWIELHLYVFLLQLWWLWKHRLLWLNISSLILQFHLCLFSQLRNTILVCITGTILRNNFWSLAVFCNCLRIFVALVTQLQNSSLLRLAKSSVVRISCLMMMTCISTSTQVATW